MTMARTDSSAGASGEGTPEPPDSAPMPAEMARAEEMVDQMAQTLGSFASQLSLQVLKGAARAREEMEDIWAEVQSIRRGQS
jgi:hypothetical protein